MPRRTTKLKTFLSILRVLLPGIFIVFLFAGFSYIGVYIEEDFLLMLQGGFNNSYVVGAFYVFAHLLGWILVFLIFRYPTLFESQRQKLLAPILSTVAILISQLLYYVIIFYLSTGLYVWEVTFRFSTQSEKQLAIVLLLIINSSVIFSLFANTLGILLHKKERKEYPEVSEKEDDPTDSTEGDTTSSFEDSISI